MTKVPSFKTKERPGKYEAIDGISDIFSTCLGDVDVTSSM